MLGRKQKAASDKIEAEIKILKAKLAEQESRRADVLKALEQAQEARRAVLTKDDATVGAATKKVRDLQLEADDLEKLADEYRDAIATAEASLSGAQDEEQRQAAADRLAAITAKVQEHTPDLVKGAEALEKFYKAVLAAVPAEVGFFKSLYANRPGDRPEGNNSMFSGREMVTAVMIECLYRIDPTMFDRKSGGWGSGLTLAKIMNPLAADPGFVSDKGKPEPLTPAEAVQALLISPLQARAKQILAGDIEPVLNDIRIIDRTPPKEPARLNLVITKPVKFVEPSSASSGGHLIRVFTEGAREDVIEPIGRLLIAKSVAYELNSDRGQSWWDDFEQRLKEGRVASSYMRSDLVDLGDPMGCLEPANDDDITDEVARALG